MIFGSQEIPCDVYQKEIEDTELFHPSQLLASPSLHDFIGAVDCFDN